jgi:hypothetical protein
MYPSAQRPPWSYRVDCALCLDCPRCRASVSLSHGLPLRLGCCDHPVPSWHPVATASRRERAGREGRRSWAPCGVAGRAALFAGLLAGGRWITGSRVQPCSMPLLGQADNARRLVAHHDDSVGRSCPSPCATRRGGVRWCVPRDRRACPLHRRDGQSRRWGVWVTPASGGEACHLYRTPVIPDYVVLSLHP